VSLFMKNPVLGVGTGGYKKATLASGGDVGVDHPHNSFLYMAVSFGAVGIVAFLWFFWLLVKNGWTNRKKPLGFFVFSVALVYLAGGITETNILDAGGAFFLAITTGLQSSLSKDRGTLQ